MGLISRIMWHFPYPEFGARQNTKMYRRCLSPYEFYNLVVEKGGCHKIYYNPWLVYWREWSCQGSFVCMEKKCTWSFLSSLWEHLQKVQGKLSFQFPGQSKRRKQQCREKWFIFSCITLYLPITDCSEEDHSGAIIPEATSIIGLS